MHTFHVQEFFIIIVQYMVHPTIGDFTLLNSYDITLVPVSHYNIIMGGIRAGGAYCGGRSFSVKGVSITAKSHMIL